MNFRELPIEQKLLAFAHTLSAAAAFLAACSAVLAMAERGTLPTETKSAQPDGGRARDYFK